MYPPCVICQSPTCYICGGCAYDRNQRVPLCEDKNCIAKHNDREHREDKDKDKGK